MIRDVNVNKPSNSGRTVPQKPRKPATRFIPVRGGVDIDVSYNQPKEDKRVKKIRKKPDYEYSIGSKILKETIGSLKGGMFKMLQKDGISVNKNETLESIATKFYRYYIDSTNKLYPNDWFKKDRAFFVKAADLNQGDIEKFTLKVKKFVESIIYEFARLKKDYQKGEIITPSETVGAETVEDIEDKVGDEIINRYPSDDINPDKAGAFIRVGAGEDKTFLYVIIAFVLLIIFTQFNK